MASIDVISTAEGFDLADPARRDSPSGNPQTRRVAKASPIRSGLESRHADARVGWLDGGCRMRPSR